MKKEVFMKKNIIRIAVTGGLGQIAYSLLFRLANGDVLGSDQQIALHILEVPFCKDALKGIVMELLDGCYPLLKEIVVGVDPEEVFENVDLALLIGAKPRGEGMERKDLLIENAKIFQKQGKALNDKASKDVKVLVVGNPCNTNCLIAMHNAPDLKRENFHAMTFLDQNRATSFLAKKTNSLVDDVQDVFIWGNHSATQVPDYFNAKVKDKYIKDLIDIGWLQNDFFEKVQKRGSEIIKIRKKSSAGSAAQAIIDFIKALFSSKRFSSAICSDNNKYDIVDDLIFSFPVFSDNFGNCNIIENLKFDAFLEEKIKITEKELLEEKDLIAHLL
jgi:malate dehydrogenase